jgi:hypothetical protein
VNIHTPKVTIKQPDGVHYMIQTHFYSRGQAQEYIDILIYRSEAYIAQKRRGEHAAPLMTIEQLEIQLGNIKKFEILDVV